MLEQRTMTIEQLANAQKVCENISVIVNGCYYTLIESQRQQTATPGPTIKSLSATYTGGGVWLFNGELESGEYFLTGDNGDTRLLNASADDFDVSLYAEWQEEHLIKDLEGDELSAFLSALLERLRNPRILDNVGGFDRTDYLICKDNFERR